MTDPGDWRPGPPRDVPISDPFGGEVAVAPVGAAEPTPKSRLIGRLVAVTLSLALLGGGAVLVVSAGTSTGGSDGPEEAVEKLLASLSAGDLLGAAEVIEPTERATLVEAGIDVAGELVRLEVLSPDLDLSALLGVELRFDDLALRSVPIRDDITQVFIDGGNTSLTVDVSKMPLGRLILDRAPEDWLVLTESVSSPLNSSKPVAVVERDGRWYVSLWYSLAENARISSRSAVPSASEALAPIGAETPEAAVDRLVREVIRLDPRTVIGMLDPEELAALYDYAPLFLDDAERAANDLLEEADRSRVVWSLDSISLSSSTDGDIATVTIGGIDMSASSPDFGGRLSMNSDRLVVEWIAPDYTGRSVRTTLTIEDGCTTVESSVEDNRFDSCRAYDADGINGTNGGFFGIAPIGGLGALGPLGSLGSSFVDPASLGVVTHRVDGRWFVSPIRTTTTAILTGMRALEPSDLVDALDAFESIFIGFDESFESGFDQSFESATPGVSPFDTPAGPPTVSATVPPSVTVFDVPAVDPVSAQDIAGIDLVNPDTPAFSATDIAGEVGASFLAGWGIETGGHEIQRSLYVDSPGSTVSNLSVRLTIVEFVDPAVADLVVAEQLTFAGSVMGPDGIVKLSTEFYRPRMLVAVDGRLILGIGVESDVVRELVALQLSR